MTKKEKVVFDPDGKKAEGEDATTMEEWLASRPEVIQKMVAKYPPGRLYRLNGTGCMIVAYAEDGTVRVDIRQIWNEHPLFMERSVFGVDPATLEVVP